MGKGSEDSSGKFFFTKIREGGGRKSGIERVRAAKKKRQDGHGLISVKAGRISLYLFAIAACFVTAGLALGKRTVEAAPEGEPTPQALEIVKECAEENPPKGPGKEDTSLGGHLDREWLYMGDLEIAAYTMTERDRTFSGKKPRDGVTMAADFSQFELGDQIRIGGSVYVVEDKVGDNATEDLCIYFESIQDAWMFGRQIQPVYRKRENEPEDTEFLIGRFEVTGYCSCDICCGEKEEKLTKSGTVPRAGYTAAADPDVLPLGTYIQIEGTIYLVEDTGREVKGNVIDLYFDSHEEAVNFGRQKHYVYEEKNYEENRNDLKSDKKGDKK